MADIFYNGTGSNISITTSEAINAIVFMLANKGSADVIQKFCYPAKTGYTTFTKTGNVYTAILNGDLTEIATESMIIYSMKIWDSNDIPVVDEGNVIISKNTLASKEDKPV